MHVREVDFHFSSIYWIWKNFVKSISVKKLSYLGWFILGLRTPVWITTYFEKHICLSLCASMYQQMLLIKVVTYASLMTKLQGHPLKLGALRWPQGCHTKSWSNEKISLTKVVRFASVMEKITHPCGGAPGIFLQGCAHVARTS